MGRPRGNAPIGLQLAVRLSAAVRNLNLFGENWRLERRLLPGDRKIVLTGNCFLLCPQCGELHHLELRRMNSRGEIRNQPRCPECRGGPKTKGK